MRFLVAGGFPGFPILPFGTGLEFGLHAMWFFCFDRQQVTQLKVTLIVDHLDRILA